MNKCPVASINRKTNGCPQPLSDFSHGTIVLQLAPPFRLDGSQHLSYFSGKDGRFPVGLLVSEAACGICAAADQPFDGLQLRTMWVFPCV